MRLEELYPLKGFKITEITQTPSDKVLIKAVSTSRSATCPYCQTPSHKRHSSYNRKPQALPCSDTPAQLVLSVQRYFCQDPDCIRKTFAERIPDTASFYARRTTCLETVLKCIAFEMSAEAASRVCEQFNVQISADSVLRLIRRTHLSRAEQVRVLGVDDWAIKKGQNYGTILVDLERRRTIELLPDRTQETLSEWLKKHPEIEVISRDRSFEYKAGIETGAPQAMQVVDRWHLLHNLREKLQEIIPGQRKKGNSDKKTKETPSYHQRKKYFELVKYLHDKGYSQRTIARVLGISRGTVRRYQEEADVPDWRPRKRPPSQLDAYEKYLRRRWAEGCRDITTLWKELQQKGYRGKRKSVARYLQRFREQTPFRSTRQLARLFMKDASELQDEESVQLVSLFKECPKLREIYQHAQTFQQMIAQQLPERLDDWLVQMESCGIKKLQNFAWGLRQDYDAVRAALTCDWSNGQVEGQVNRLKTIKHQMYGRANFDLLRQRVLGPP